MNLIEKLFSSEDFPQWLQNSIFYSTMMGSHAYGVATPSSDIDCVAICIPPKRYLFPHTEGWINGWQAPPYNFECIQRPHIKIEEKEYDLKVYSITHFFKLAAKSNPELIECLFTRQSAIMHCNLIGQLIRDNRNLFLSKMCFNTFRGYALSQYKLVFNRERQNSVRAELVKEQGYDWKAAYHLCRLIEECSQILENNDLDLQKSSDFLKEIRTGKISKEEIEKWFLIKENELLNQFEKSKIQEKPDLSKINNLLIQCISMVYGNINNLINNSDENRAILDKIRELVN